MTLLKSVEECSPNEKRNAHFVKKRVFLAIFEKKDHESLRIRGPLIYFVIIVNSASRRVS